MAGIPADKQVILICNDEEEEEAWKILMDNGYDPTLVKILDGGIKQWKDQGYQLRKELSSGC